MSKLSTRGLEQEPLQQVFPTEPELRCNRLTLKLIWKRFWKVLSLHSIESTQLRVWHQRDREGNIWWSAYDPITGQSVDRISEAQMRIWIEKRHHRSAVRR